MNLVDIKHYEGLYSFDLNTNQVFGHKKKHYLKPVLGKTGYYITQLSKKGKPKTIKYHRLIYEYNNLDKDISDLFIDHIDRNKLNNNIDNLRLVNKSENNCNIEVRKHNKSTGIKNIHINNKNKFIVQITKNKIIYRKSFNTLEEALEIKKNKLKELHGEFATE